MPFLLAKESGKQQKWVRADPCKGRVVLTVLAPRTTSSTSRWQMSGPKLTYHTERNSWDLISQALNNWTRLQLASEWSPSRQLSVFMGSNACDSSGNVNRRLLGPFLRSDPEGKGKQNSGPEERCQSHCFFLIYFWFSLSILQQCFGQCPSYHFVCKANGKAWSTVSCSAYEFSFLIHQFALWLYGSHLPYLYLSFPPVKWGKWLLYHSFF